MSIEKNLIVKERKHVWALLLQIKHDGRRPYTDELATFSKRPMALCGMAASVNAFNKWMMADHMYIHATAEGVEKLESVGIYDASCNV